MAVTNYATADVAAFIVELMERTPARDRTAEYFDAAIARKFPGVEIEQLHQAQEIAMERLRRGGI